MLGERQSSLLKPKDESKILQQLKEKFHSTAVNSVKVQILTIIPKSWSISMIRAEFGASNFDGSERKTTCRGKGYVL